MLIILIGTAFLLSTQSGALAQNSPEELRKIARNPFADENVLPFEEGVTPTAYRLLPRGISLNQSTWRKFQVSEL